MGQPVYAIAGVPSTSGKCGDTITFDVPGYQRAWIVVYQDGRPTFDGIMDLPMPPYALKCPQDIGNFQVAAYEITAQGTRGGVIGQTSFTVTAGLQPQQQPQPTAQPTDDGTSTPGSGGGSTPPPIVPVGGGTSPIDFVPGDSETTEASMFGMDTITLVLLGIGALFVLPQLFRSKKGGS